MKNKSDLYKFDALLGTQPDAQIAKLAKLAKVYQGAVNKRRRSLGIASFHSKTPSRIARFDFLLGVCTYLILETLTGR